MQSSHKVNMLLLSFKKNISLVKMKSVNYGKHSFFLVIFVVPPIKTILSTGYSSPTNINHKPTFKMHAVDFQSAVSCKSPLGRLL